MQAQKHLRIGTRGSQLALTQTHIVRDALQVHYPNLTIEIVVISTTGDKVTDRHLAEIGGKALFAKELEAALMDNSIDIAVHSLKDMPGFLPEGLIIDCVLPREDARDVLVSPHYNNIDALPNGAVIGTSSPRRKAQLLHQRPDLHIKLIRGNVETRLKKVEQGEYDATLLACAGLKRLSLFNENMRIISEKKLLPAIGQGVIAIERRIQDNNIQKILESIHCINTYSCINAEREVMRVINGSCYTPLAAYATLVDGNIIELHAELLSEDGKKVAKAHATGHKAEAQALGRQVGERLINNDNIT